MTRPRFDFDPAARRIADTRGLPPGATSDDSQLADVVADGLAMACGYHHELQVLLHLKALWNSVAGWGGTTKRSLYQIDKWYRARRKGFGINPPPDIASERDQKLWQAAEERHPDHPALPAKDARGNGPSMKIAPLGLHFALLGGGDFETGEALEPVLRLSRMTHHDPVCAVAAYAVASTVCSVFTDGPTEAKRRLMPSVKGAESAWAFLHRHGGRRFSDALAEASAMVDAPEHLWAFGSQDKADSMTTVPMALAIWWRHAEDAEPTAAVLEAINAGGDTDTVASMVGAMMGVASGRHDWWPAAWIESLADRGSRAKLIGSQLFGVSSLRKMPIGFDLKDLKKSLGY